MNVNFSILDDSSAPSKEMAGVYLEGNRLLNEEILREKAEAEEVLLGLDREKLSGKKVPVSEYSKAEAKFQKLSRKAHVIEKLLETLSSRIPERRREESLTEIKARGENLKGLNAQMRELFEKGLPHLCRFLAYREAFGDFSFNIHDFSWLKDFGCPVQLTDNQDIKKVTAAVKSELGLPAKGPAREHRNTLNEISKLEADLRERNDSNLLQKVLKEYSQGKKSA